MKKEINYNEYNQNYYSNSLCPPKEKQYSTEIYLFIKKGIEDFYASPLLYKGEKVKLNTHRQNFKAFADAVNGYKDKTNPIIVLSTVCGLYNEIEEVIIEQEKRIETTKHCKKIDGIIEYITNVVNSEKITILENNSSKINVSNCLKYIKTRYWPSELEKQFKKNDEDISALDMNISEQNEFILSSINKLKVDLDQIDTEQREQRAFIIAQIGNLHSKLNNHLESIYFFELSKKFYSIKQKKFEYALILLRLARESEILNRYEQFLNYLRELEELPPEYIQYIASGRFMMTIVLFNNEKYSSAQTYLDDLKFLSSTYPLFNSILLDTLQERLNFFKNLHEPLDISFNRMISILYKAIEKSHDSEKIIRYWYWVFQDRLIKSFYKLNGLHVVIVGQTLDSINKCILKLSWLFDFFLITSNEIVFRGPLDAMHYPFGKLITSDQGNYIEKIYDNKNNLLQDAIDLKKNYTIKFQYSNSISNGYKLFAKKFRHKQELFLTGRGIGLPSIIYEFIKSNSLKTISSSNTFTIKNFGKSGKSALYDNIFFSSRLNFFLIYTNQEIFPDDVSIIGELETFISCKPFMDIRKNNEVKKLINGLFNIDQSKVKPLLYELKIGLQHLFINEVEKIPITILLARITTQFKDICHPIIIIHPNESNNNSR